MSADSSNSARGFPDRREHDPLDQPDAIAQFVACVYQRDDVVEVRLLRKGKVEGKSDAKSSWHRADDLKQQAARLASANKLGWNIYLGANPRKRRGGAKEKDVACARCLFADFDGIDVDEARRRWDSAGLPEPTLLITSGHGVHAYWRLTELITDLAEWTSLQRALIGAVGSDPSIHDPPRIMRLPGFLNGKFEPHVPCTIVSADHKRRYPLDRLRQVLGGHLAASEPKPSAAVPVGPIGDATRGLDVLSRAAAYVDKIPNVAQGQRNAQAFKVAAALVNDFGLSDDEARLLLQRWNGDNTPPLDNRELGDVLASARRHSKHTPGAKIVEAKKGKPSTKPKRRPPPLDPYKSFPVGALPEPIRSFVIQAARAIGCDTSYIALPLLAALAATIGNKRRIKLKRGWCEPSVLWCAIVGESGTLKSPALDKGLAPLRRRQTRALQEYREDMKRYERERLIYDADQKEWKARGRKKGEQPPEPPEEPKAERFLVSVITVEALVDRLNENPNGLLMEQDELAGWLKSFDQYKGGRGGDAAQWLSMHRAGPVLCDRKTGRKILFAERGAVSVCGGIQPEILRMAMAREHFDDGLGARLLLAMPPTKVKRWTEAEVDEQTEAAIEIIFERLLALESAADDAGNEIPFDLRLTTEAKSAWITWFNSHAREQAELTGDLAAAWSKLEGYTPRLALIVHLVRVAGDDPTIESPDRVDAVSIRSGCMLADWFGQEARRVYGVLGESDEDREERRLVELVARRGGQITPRELMRASRQYRGSSEEAEAALEELVKAGRGKWEIDQDQAGGRPTRTFVLCCAGDGDTTGEKPDEAEVLSPSPPNDEENRTWTF